MWQSPFEYDSISGGDMTMGIGPIGQSGAMRFIQAQAMASARVRIQGILR